MADPENRIIAVNSNASSDVEKFSGKDGASSSIDIRGSTVDNNSAALAKTWKKIDYVVLPIVAMFYLLSFLDRTNLANARVAGLQDDLKLTNYQYCIALTVTFIPYIAIEIPSNLVLKVRAYKCHPYADIES
ncbi:hypothetical protein C0991_008010 [Blastosporella zonata]|nr:hypothetical protein C0991_008010 [Blastosporella zonata]